MNTPEVIYHLFGNTVVVHVDSKTYTISKDDKRFDLIQKMINESAFDTLRLVIDANSNYFKVTQRILESLQELKVA